MQGAFPKKEKCPVLLNMYSKLLKHWKNMAFGTYIPEKKCFLHRRMAMGAVPKHIIAVSAFITNDRDGILLVKVHCARILGRCQEDRSK